MWKSNESCWYVWHRRFICVIEGSNRNIHIYNAGRGGKPVRLQMQEKKEALNGEWLDNYAE